MNTETETSIRMHIQAFRTTLNTYTAIWEEVKRKAPQRTIEIDYEGHFDEAPKRWSSKLARFIFRDFQFENTPKDLFRKLTSPFREHYSLKFKS